MFVVTLSVLVLDEELYVTKVWIGEDGDVVHTHEFFSLVLLFAASAIAVGIDGNEVGTILCGEIYQDCILLGEFCLDQMEFGILF